MSTKRKPTRFRAGRTSPVLLCVVPSSKPVNVLLALAPSFKVAVRVGKRKKMIYRLTRTTTNEWDLLIMMQKASATGHF